MDLDTLYKIMGILGGVSVLLVPFIRGLMQRVTDLELQVRDCTTESKVRQLIKDAVDPLREDIKQIDNKVDKVDGKVDKVIDMLLANKSN